ncbi:hypothetical protein QBC38DRAFT_491175 [Podospora fimiseda]|uniref:Uncharacterized protein n=1 Tax=Podospora fimiseda TaxID=252190 RepID=A0AAN7BFB9_9PEZI|nr:hypothetical protein QBC38DRAFT_491175 [Podospora fimiseda]
MPSGKVISPANGGFSFRRLGANLTATAPSESTSGPSANGTAPTINSQEDVIFFPKVYEDAWGGQDAIRTDIDRARIFLYRIASMSGDTIITNSLRAIIGDPTHSRTVPSLASAVQTTIYKNYHSTFTPTPLLQAVRFMLIKANIPSTASQYGVEREKCRAVLDFFFDPSIHRNLNPLPPGELIKYPYPSGCLKVCIIGGGPTGLASAISLAEKGAGKVEVHVWERRWITRPDGVVDYPPTAKRRDQVVTLQDTVTNLLSPLSFQALFAGRPERVWPGSANIQIRKVEDRFLQHCQTDKFRGLIHLHAEGMTREELAAGKAGDFHVLLGTDGAASWVRKGYFHGYEKERGRSYALGLAFDRGSKAGLPWSQPLNMFLTLGQTRYLLNASDHDGRGYLNMQLTEEEWHKMVSIDGQPVHFGRPGCFRRPDGSIPDGFTEAQIFAPSEDRSSNLWKSIEDGLKLFGFKENEVINVVRIPIVVQAVREGVQMLPLEDSRYVRRPHGLVAVAGDAAMTVHFWPGRGLNSGIKSGIALGDEICHALRGGRFAGVQLSAMKKYNDFILKLQDREHDKRSIPILNQSGTPETLGWLLSNAHSVPDEVAVEWLVGAMTQIADRLEQRPDWHFPHEANIEPQIRIVLRQLHSLTLREMAVSFPWPTREMAGAEVLPIRSMKPDEKQKWIQSLWGILNNDKKKEAARGRSPNPTVSKARFEAPRLGDRARSKSPLPDRNAQSSRNASPVSAQIDALNLNSMSLSDSVAGSLRRSNAGKLSPHPSTQSGWERSRRYSYNNSLTVPGAPNSQDNRYHAYQPSAYDRYNDSESDTYGSRSTSPHAVSPVSINGGSDVGVGLTRLLSVKKPNASVFSEAMALALFRVDEDK